MNIIIHKSGNKIFFEEYKIVPSKDKLNVTNIWNFKEIIFEEDKLNEEFIQIFLKELFFKEKIKIVSIEQICMIPMIFNLIGNISTIDEIIIKEKQMIPSNYYNDIKKLKYVKTLECYQMTSFLFDECTKNLKLHIIYKKQEFIKSNFMIGNDLNTHSKIFYKKKIHFYDTYNYEDLSDFEYFVSENKYLEKIEYYGTNIDIIEEMLQYLLKNNKKNIHIQILQREEEQEILETLVNLISKNFKKELKSSNINLEIKYTKKYKEKNILKQLNLNIFRLSLLILLVLTSSIYCISKIHTYSSKKEVKEIEKIKEEIDTIENDDTIVEDEENDTTIDENEEDLKEETNTDTSTNTNTTTNKVETYSKNMEALKKTNSEFTGWLTINNTSISYPVVKHSDNEFYLSHGFNKKYNINGWIFMDYRNHTETFDQNTIIYGHDSNYDIMFGGLKKVLEKSWYTNSKNQIITYETSKQKYEAVIFSIYIIDNTTDYLQVVFSDSEFSDFIKMITDRSIYNFNTEVSTSDKIITLSTCYKDSSKRLVVHAKIK